MKFLNLVLLMLILAAGVSAQASSGATDAPGVSVIRHRWRQVVRNPALDEDPFRANNEQREVMRVERETIRQNTIRVQSGQTPLPSPRRRSSTLVIADTSTRYVYEANVSNTGSKTIRELEWEYVLFDPTTQRVIGNRRFTTEASIRPGRSKRLIGHSTLPPATVVDVTQTGEQGRGQFSERVIIHRVVYTDGSLWQRTSN